MLLSGIVHTGNDAPEFVVYFHIARGSLFYIGSGVLSRAFDSGKSRRNETWNAFANGDPVSVYIAGRFVTRSEARRVEYEFIRKFRPVGNAPREPDILPEWVEWEIEGWRVARDPDLGTTIVVLPEGWTFSCVRGAANAMRVSPSAVCNSISGRHPVVAGHRFARVKVADLPEFQRAYRGVPIVSG